MSIREIDEETIEKLFVPLLTKFAMRTVREFDKSDMRACAVDYPMDRNVNAVVAALRKSADRMNVDVTVKKSGDDIYMLKGGIYL